MKNRICIVDDTPELLQNVSQYLRLEGFEVLSCKDGSEALRNIPTFKPDLIITDQYMPTMDGYELIENIVKNSDLNNIPLVVFSASVLSPRIKELQKSRFVGYIAKPVEMGEFVAAINNFL